MEFYNLQTGKTATDENKTRDWFRHDFGIIDLKGGSFLDELEEKINAVYQSVLLQKGDRAGKYQDWIYNKETPIAVVEVKKTKVLVWRKDSYYISFLGQRIIELDDVKSGIITAMNEVLRRKENCVIDEKERACCFWILNKKGVKIKWQNG